MFGRPKRIKRAGHNGNWKICKSSLRAHNIFNAVEELTRTHIDMDGRIYKSVIVRSATLSNMAYLANRARRHKLDYENDGYFGNHNEGHIYL